MLTIPKPATAPTALDYFKHLQSEVFELYSRWIIHRQLFRRKPARELMNCYASNMFSMFQQLLEDDMFLRISRLTDPKTTKIGGVDLENLTFELLIDKIDSNPASKRTARAKATLKRIRTACQKIRTHRKKRIAHSDAATKLSSPSPLEIILVKDVSKLMRDVEKLTSQIAKLLQQPPSRANALIIPGDGAIMLLHLRRLHALYTAAVKSPEIRNVLNNVE